MARLNPGTRIYGTGTVDSTLFINAGVNASNTATGSLQVIGGAGIGQNLYVGGQVFAQGWALTTSTASLTGGATGSIPYQISAGVTGFIGIATTSGWVLTSNGTTSSFAPATGGGGTSIAIVNNTTTSALQFLTFASTTTGTLSTLQTAGPNGLVYQPSTGFHGIGTTGTLVSPLHVALAYAGPVATGVSPTPFVALTLDNPGNVVSAAVAMDFRTFYPGYGNAGYTTSTIMYDFQGGGLGVNGINGPGPTKGPGSWGMNYISGRSGFAHHWFRDIDYNVQFSVVNNGTIATGYVAQSYDFTPQYSALIQGNIGIGTTVTNARLTVAGGATMTGIFTATSGATASNTQTGALQVAGGVGIGGALFVGSTSSVAYLRVNSPAVGSTGQYSIVKGESWFYTSSFTDPDSGVLRSMKIGDSGLAVTGGIKSDNFTATNAIAITSAVTATNTTTGGLIVTGGAAVGYNLIVGNQALVGQTSVNVIGVSGGFVASPAFIVGGQTTESMYIRRSGSGNYTLQTYNSGNVGNLALQPYGGQVSIGTNGVTQPNASASTSTNTGMVIVGGGIGVADSVYVGNRMGFVNNVNVSAVYQVYNTSTQSLDTIFG